MLTLSRLIVWFVFLNGVLLPGVLKAQTKNPILSAADPFITWQPVNGNYLLLATNKTNITIWYGPSVPAAASKSKTVYTPRDGMIELWSPTIWNRNGHWWIYFTAKYPGKVHGIFVLESETGDPLGSYNFLGQIDLGRATIDPSLLMLNGKTYLMYVSVDGGENAIRMVELDDPMRPVGEKALIAEPDQTWEKGVIHNNYPVAEGPTALYHDGRTFIVYSGSNTMSANYCLGLLTYLGGDPLDRKNWKKTGPVFKSAPANGIYSPGRGAFAKSVDGNTFWLLYHAKKGEEITMAGRETRAQTFTWNPDGTPDFGVPLKDGPVDSAK